jgi:tetratricopeptide (TPR) repeat protein
LGIVYFERNQYRQALECFEKFLKDAPGLERIKVGLMTVIPEIEAMIEMSREEVVTTISRLRQEMPDADAWKPSRETKQKAEQAAKAFEKLWGISPRAISLNEVAGLPDPGYLIDRPDGTIDVYLRPDASIKTIRHELRAATLGVTHLANIMIDEALRNYPEYLEKTYPEFYQRLMKDIQRVKAGEILPVRDWADELDDIGDKLRKNVPFNQFWFAQDSTPRPQAVRDWLYGVAAYNIARNYSGGIDTKISDYLADLLIVQSLNQRLWDDPFAAASLLKLFKESPRNPIDPINPDNAVPFAPDLVGKGDPACRKVYVPLLFSFIKAKGYTEDKLISALPELEALHNKLTAHSQQVQSYLSTFYAYEDADGGVHSVEYVSNPQANTPGAKGYREFLFYIIGGHMDFDGDGVDDYVYMDLAGESGTAEERARYWIADFENVGELRTKEWNKIAKFHGYT